MGANAKEINFVVEDMLPSAGLEKVELSDGAGKVYQSWSTFTEGNKFTYSGSLGASLTGQGTKYLKLKVRDNLGHEESETIPFQSDFVAPKINSVVLADFTQPFVGSQTKSTNLKVVVEEQNGLEAVTASSPQINFYSEVGSCEADPENAETWICTWSDILVNPEATVAVTITAVDEYGNTGAKTQTFSFIKDTSAPEVLEFGTPFSYEDKYYIKSGAQKIILKVSDEGSWLEKTGIAANLVALGGSARQEPNECVQSESSYDCSWSTTKSLSGSSSGEKKSISLVKLEDRAGNAGQLPTRELIVDAKAPLVENVEVYGLSDKQNNFFQSGDLLFLKLKIQEETGIVVKVDLNELMNDAELEFPKTLQNEAGWAVFDQSQCERMDNAWECSISVATLKSGYIASVPFNIEVSDTAGNIASSWPTEAKNVDSLGRGQFSLELLAVDEESTPEYWEISGGLTYAPNFIDLSMTHLIPSRISVQVPLVSVQNAVARSVIPGSCVLAEGWEGPELEVSGKYVYGVGAEPGKLKTTLVLELGTFVGAEMFAAEIAAQQQLKGAFSSVKVPFVCTLLISSQANHQMIKSLEEQTVPVEVTFGFTKLTSSSVGLDEKIKEARESFWTGLAGFTAMLKRTLKYVEYACTILHSIDTFITAIGTISIFVDKSMTPVEGGATGKSMCASMETFRAGGWGNLMRTLEWGCRISSCEGWSAIFGDKKDVKISKEDILWETGKTQEDRTQSNEKVEGWSWIFGGLQTANQFGATKLTRTSYSADDSLILSILAACPSGIVYNLDKLTQIQCRYIYCLEKEVPAGIATLESCEKLRGYQVCTNVVGEIFYSIPFAQAIVDSVQNIVLLFKSSFLGWYSALVSALCPKLCAKGADFGTLCGWLQVGDRVLSLWDNIAAIGQSPKALAADYCSEMGITWAYSSKEESTVAEEEGAATTDIIGEGTAN